MEEFLLESVNEIMLKSMKELLQKYLKQPDENAGDISATISNGTHGVFPAGIPGAIRENMPERMFVRIFGKQLEEFMKKIHGRMFEGILDKVS